MRLPPHPLPEQVAHAARVLAASYRDRSLASDDYTGGRMNPSPEGIARLRQQLRGCGRVALRTGGHRVVVLLRGFALKIPIHEGFLRTCTSEPETWKAADPRVRAHLCEVRLVDSVVAVSPRLHPITARDWRRIGDDVIRIAYRGNIPDARRPNVAWTSAAKDHWAFIDYGYCLAPHWPPSAWPRKAPSDMLAFTRDWHSARTA